MAAGQPRPVASSTAADIDQIAAILHRDARGHHPGVRGGLIDQLRRDQRDLPLGIQRPADRPDPIGHRLAIHRREGLEEGDQGRRVLIVQQRELLGGHEEQRRPIRLHPVADGALPIEVAEPRAHPAAPARQIGRIEERDRRDVDEDLTAEIGVVAPGAPGDRDRDVAAAGDRDGVGGDGERVTRHRPLPGEVAAGVAVERGPGQQQHGDNRPERPAGIAQDLPHGRWAPGDE